MLITTTNLLRALVGLRQISRMKRIYAAQYSINSKEIRLRGNENSCNSINSLFKIESAYLRNLN